MITNILGARAALWRKFWRADSRLFYERDYARTEDFPTAEEIAAGIPNTAGWGTGMEDGALNGGWILDGLLQAHRVTGEAAVSAQAREVFQGLTRLGCLGPTRGFVVRAAAPGRDDFYENSSADQFTSFVCAMLWYARSPLARSDEKAEASRLLGDVARLVESFHDDIPTVDLQPSIYGDTSAIKPDRACRLLLFYKAAHALTGDAHWEGVYRDRALKDGGARLACCHGPEPVPFGCNLHAHYQSQAAFRVLFELETDPTFREAWRRALNTTAAAVMGQVDSLIQWKPFEGERDLTWRESWDQFIRQNPGSRFRDVEGRVEFLNFHWERTPGFIHDIRKLRPPVEALGICMMAEDAALRADAARRASAALTTADFSRVHTSTPLASLEAAWWRGVAAGCFAA